MEKVLVKAFLGSEARRFYFAPNRQEETFQEFQNSLKESFPDLKSTPFFITWKDRDGDEVRISSSEELFDAMKENKQILKSDIFKVIVETKGSSKGGKRESPTRYGDKQLHPDVMCDGCQGQVRGIRFKCAECEDYDLCAECEARDVHAGHTMLKIKTPIIYDQPFGPFVPPGMFADGYGPPPFPFRTAPEGMYNTRSSPCRFTEIYSDDETGERKERRPSPSKSHRRNKSPPTSKYRPRTDPYYGSMNEPMYGSMYDSPFCAPPYFERPSMLGLPPPPIGGMHSSPIPPPEILGLFAAMMDPIEMEGGRRPGSANLREPKEKTKKKDKKVGKGKHGKKHKKLSRDSGASKHKNRQSVRREEDSDSEVEEVIEDLASASLQGKKHDEESLRDYVVVSPDSEFSEVTTPEQEVPTVEDVTSPVPEKGSPSPMPRQPQEVPNQSSTGSSQNDRSQGARPQHTIDELLSISPDGIPSYPGSEHLERPSYLPGIGMYPPPSHGLAGGTLPSFQRPTTGTHLPFPCTYVPTAGVGNYASTVPTMGGTYVPSPSTGFLGGSSHIPSPGIGSHVYPSGAGMGSGSHLPSFGLGTHGSTSSGVGSNLPSYGSSSYLSTPGSTIYTPSVGLSTSPSSYGLSSHLSSPSHLHSSGTSTTAGLYPGAGSRLSSRTVGSHLPSSRVGRNGPLSSSNINNHRPLPKVGSYSSPGRYNSTVGSHLPYSATGSYPSTSSAGNYHAGSTLYDNLGSASTGLSSSGINRHGTTDSVPSSSTVGQPSSQGTSSSNLSYRGADSLPQSSRINTLSHITSQRLNDAFSPPSQRGSYTPSRPEPPSYSSLRPSAPAPTEGSSQQNNEQTGQRVSHHDPRVEKSLKIMLDMGFTDEDGWLTQLLELKRGDIDQALEVLAPVTTTA